MSRRRHRRLSIFDFETLVSVIETKVFVVFYCSLEDHESAIDLSDRSYPYVLSVGTYGTNTPFFLKVKPSLIILLLLSPHFDFTLCPVNVDWRWIYGGRSLQNNPCPLHRLMCKHRSTLLSLIQKFLAHLSCATCEMLLIALKMACCVYGVVVSSRYGVTFVVFACTLVIIVGAACIYNFIHDMRWINFLHLY